MPEITDCPGQSHNKGILDKRGVDLACVDQMLQNLVPVRHPLRDVPVRLTEKRGVLFDVVDHVHGVSQRLARILPLLGR